MSVEASVDPELALPAFCRYSVGVKIFILIGIPFFFSIFVLIGRAVLSGQGHWIANVLGSGLAAIGLYATWLGCRAARFMNIELVVSEQGLDISKGPGAPRFHAWSELARYDDSPILQVFEIRDKTNKVVVFVDCYLDNFAALQAATVARVPGA